MLVTRSPLEVQKLDSGHCATDTRPHHAHERELERDVFAAVGANHAAAARAVKPENHPLIEVVGKSLAVVFVGHLSTE
jgi:hypothetical protein